MQPSRRVENDSFSLRSGVVKLFSVFVFFFFFWFFVTLSLETSGPNVCEP